MPLTISGMPARNPQVTNKPGLANSSRLENFDEAGFQLDLDVGVTGAVRCVQVFGTAVSCARRKASRL